MKSFSHAIRLVLLAGIMLTTLPACTETSDPAVGATTITPEHWPTTEGGIPIDPEIETRIDEILASMTVEEKVAQTIQGDINSITPEDVRQYRLGSVLNGGNSAPGLDVRAPAEEWLELADAFYEASMDTTGGRKAIPVLWGTDAVHGHGNIVGATVFPHNIGLGAANNPDLMREIGAVTAREIRVTGQEWTFAPTLAVVRNDRWGRTYEGYSEDGEIVAAYAPAIIEGLQGAIGSDEFLAEDKVIASAKHFVGDGGTDDGVDQGNNTMDEASFRDLQAAGYPPAIEAGAQAIMASYNSWHGRKLHGYKELLTDVLKEQMGFNGFVVGDWNGHGQVQGCDPTSCAASMNAGLDMFMAPDTWKPLYENTLAQVQSGEIPRERLEDAVRRILRVKLRMGLLEMPRPSERPMAGQWELLGAPEHLDVARQAVRESLVLLKNEGGVLPLSADAHVLVAGDGANDIGKQSGGWTLSWQGTGNSREDFPNGTSIWDGLRGAIEAGGGRAELSVDGSYTDRPDVAVVVFGEDPYAEMFGDRANLDYEPNDGLELLRAFQAEGIPTVSVFLSGRPLFVNPELNASDAFVAAWLPGSQGDGVAQVLVRNPDGSVNHDFKGKLSYSWPRTAVQTPLNRGQEGYDPLFPYGFGLTYGDDGSLAGLPEDSGIVASGSDQGVFFSNGAISDPVGFMVYFGDQFTPVQDANVIAGPVTVRSVDRAAQEDARQFAWDGSAQAAVLLMGPPMDYTGDEAQSLAIGYRVDEVPSAPVELGVDCGEACLAAVDISDELGGVETGTWNEMRVPLACMAEEGADLDNLRAVFAVRTAGSFTMTLSDVRLVPAEDGATCPSS